MTIAINDAARLRLYEEPNGSFGVDHTGTLGDSLNVPFIKGSCTLELAEERAEPGHVYQYIDQRGVAILLRKFAKLTLDINAETVDTKPSAGVAIAQSALGRLLKIIYGGESLGTARASSGTPGVTSIPVTSSTGLPVGNAVGCNTGAGGRAEFREIKNNATNTLTLKLATSNAQAAAVTLLPSATYYLGGTYGDQTTSAQMLFEGLHLNNRFGLFGGWCDSITWKDLGPASIPRLTVVIMFADWARADGADLLSNGVAIAANTIGSALTSVSYVNAVTNAVRASEFLQQTVGTTTRNAASEIHGPEINLTPAVRYELHRSVGGVETVKQPIRAGSDISGNFLIPFEDFTWENARRADPPTNKAFHYQIGSSFTKGGTLLSVPTCQITNVEYVPIGAITGTRVSFVGRNDLDTETSGLSGTNLDRALSAFRAHIL